jgi:hypothetical protein
MAVQVVKVKLNNHKLTIEDVKKGVKAGVDEMKWTAVGADVEVNFNYPEGCPFQDSIFYIPAGTSKKSGNPIPLTKKYRYTLTIIDPQYIGGKIIVDPQVDVDGGPPGGGPKKAATKKGAKKAARRKSAGRRGTGRKR